MVKRSSTMTHVITQARELLAFVSQSSHSQKEKISYKRKLGKETKTFFCLLATQVHVFISIVKLDILTSQAMVVDALL